MQLLQRLRERNDDDHVSRLLRLSDDTQMERFVALCQNTWNDWIQNNAVYCEGKRKNRCCREIAMKAMEKARTIEIWERDNRVGFWEVIVLNVAIMLIKWLWEKWIDGE